MDHRHGVTLFEMATETVKELSLFLSDSNRGVVVASGSVMTFFGLVHVGECISLVDILARK